MSVIHDALKKIGEPVIKQSRNIPVQPKKIADRRRKSFVFPVIVLVAAGSIFGVRLLGQGPATTPRPVSALGQFSIEETPVPAPAASHSPLMLLQPVQNKNRAPFVLSGIVAAGPDSYCLVNGVVLKQGQNIGGATVESITSEKVTLDFQGKKIELAA